MDVLGVLDAIQGKRVLILGDVMLDHYIRGSVERISAEAPVPIVQYEREEFRLGGAANVALNVHALGATPILVSVLGSDSNGDLFLERLRQISLPTTGIIRSLTRPTTLKTRIIAQHHQMLRIDRESVADLDDHEQSALIERFDDALQQHVDVLILQDYNKGTLTAAVIEYILTRALACGIPVLVDPKTRNVYAYRGVTLFKPNLKELRSAVPFEVEITTESLQRACDHVRMQLAHRISAVTLGAHGVYVEVQGQGRIYPTDTKTVADVSGAGDTVAAILALALTQTQDPDTLANLANLAGGQVVGKLGVVPIDLVELRSAIR